MCVWQDITIQSLTSGRLIVYLSDSMIVYLSDSIPLSGVSGLAVI